MLRWARVALVLLTFVFCSAYAATKEIAPHFIKLGAHLEGRRLPVFSSQSLKASQSIRRIVLIVHGIRRNAGDYFRMMNGLAEDSGVDGSDQFIIAPQFLNNNDVDDETSVPQGTLYWQNSEWKEGQKDLGGQFSSFAVLDALLITLKTRFPNVERVVLASHSAGSQMIQRYAALTTVDQSPILRGVQLHFLVASPSSYLYLDAERKELCASHQNQTCLLQHCPEFNSYPYGLENIVEYGSKLEPSEIRKNYLRHEIYYALGTADNDSDARVLDRSCAAQAQGSNRLDRGLNFVSSLARYGYMGRPILVRGATHDAKHAGRSLFQSPKILKILFE